MPRQKTGDIQKADRLVRKLLNKLPVRYRQLAIANFDSDCGKQYVGENRGNRYIALGASEILKKVRSPADALDWAFLWNHSNEGSAFWSSVIEGLRSGGPLPPLPSSTL